MKVPAGEYENARVVGLHPNDAAYLYQCLSEIEKHNRAMDAWNAVIRLHPDLAEFARRELTRIESSRSAVYAGAGRLLTRYRDANAVAAVADIRDRLQRMYQQAPRANGDTVRKFAEMARRQLGPDPLYTEG